jgi:hypothetical protein
MTVSDVEFAALLATLNAPEVLRCTVCSTPLDEVHRTIGVHPVCDPTPTSTDPPPSTITELRRILVDYEASSERSTQVLPGPSEIAVPCDRRLGYRIHQVAARADERVKWAPLVGTSVHATIAAALGAENQRLRRVRWLVEAKVYPDPALPGSCDAYDLDNSVVVDWKVVGPTRLTHYRRHGPGPQYEGQIQLYGRGWQRAGRTPRWVRIVFLPRSTDFSDAYEWTAPYDRAAADALLDRFFGVMNLLTDLDVANNPALWEKVPATPTADCAWCPWFRRGSPADGTGCPGDPDADARRIQQFTEGLLNP